MTNKITYPIHPDSQERPGVPQGRTERFTFSSSALFPGTTRDCAIYVPAGYDPEVPACVMVFQDGAGLLRPESKLPIATIFDNLIHSGEMPVTIGICVNPGVIAGAGPDAIDRPNRSYEYDGLGDRYARFLLEELLPEVALRYNLAQDGNSRAIAGGSSGGVCAFNVAWERPDAFTRVLTWVGTFTGMRGGHEFPYWVRITEPKPLRVFLQSGTEDMNIFAGSWWLANQEMLDSLEYSGYEVNHVWGEDGHNGGQIISIFPDALRWLWRGYSEPVATGATSRATVMTRVLLPGEAWVCVRDAGESIGGVAAGPDGSLYFSEPMVGRISKVEPDGSIACFAEGIPGVQGLAFGPDERLYACGSDTVVALPADATPTVVAEDIEGRDLCVTANGRIYVAEPSRGRVWLVVPDGDNRIVHDGIAAPNCLCLSPDQAQLIVNDAHSPVAHLFSVQKDGMLANHEPYFHLNLVSGSHDSGVEGIVVDREGWPYFATAAGIQVADNEGRVAALILSPRRGGSPGPIALAGPGFNELYAACGGALYKRTIQSSAARAFEPPFQPEQKLGW